MNRGRPLAVAMLALILIAALSGCSSQPSGETGTELTVRVIATQNFGKELMFDKMLVVPDETSAMEALKQIANIETAYGGGFVNAINGVHSGHTGSQGAKMDWFIMANGIMANVGALDYTLHDGDVEHWDYHDWSFRMFIPAIVGDFPEPFLHGYEGEVRPTVIVYEEGLEDVARDLENSLKELGVADVSTENTSELTENDKQHSNLILLGTNDCDLVSELNQVWDRIGFFVHFDDSTMIVHNEREEIEAEYRAGCGLLQATQSLWNPKGIGVCENVVWMVSGTDMAGVKSAADALINQHDQFQYAYAVVIADGEIIKVP